MRHSHGVHCDDSIPVPRFESTVMQRPLVFSTDQLNRRHGRHGNLGGIWRWRGEFESEAVYGQIHHPLSLMVWGAVRIGIHSPLLRWPPQVNEEADMQMLLGTCIFGQLVERYGVQDFWWQQDNARAQDGDSSPSPESTSARVGHSIAPICHRLRWCGHGSSAN
jgi:hypothetical protein